MLEEITDWRELEEIATDLDTCLSPTSPSGNIDGRNDFFYNDHVFYYSFFDEVEDRSGYIRIFCV